MLKNTTENEFSTVSKFATEVAKRYGEGSEMLNFSREKKRQENGKDIEKLRRRQNTTAATDSSAVVFLVRKGPLGMLVLKGILVTVFKNLRQTNLK